MSSTDPLQRTPHYAYDGAGQLPTSTDALRRVTTSGYGPTNWITSIAYADGAIPNVTYGLGAPRDRRDAMTGGTGATSYTYDTLGS